MSLSVTPIPAFTDNYFWAIHAADDKQQVAIVDPGDAAVVETFLRDNSLQLAAILVTHWHPDHIGGISALTAMRDIPVIGPDSPHIPQVTQKMADGDQIKLFGSTFQVIGVPGHTLDHIAFHHVSHTQSLLFCGDTLFSSGCGRIFEGDAKMMWNSINKIKQLPVNTDIYCAHEYTLSNLKFAATVEPDNQAVMDRIAEATALRAQNKPTVPTTLKQELHFNPFLRCDQKTIRNAVSEVKNIQNCDESIIFAALRGWKDTF